MFVSSIKVTIVSETLTTVYKEGFFYCLCSFTAVDAEIIARGTVGFSGAELENLVNQAALKAAVDGKEMVTMKDLEFAKDKILMGECTRFQDRLCIPFVTSHETDYLDTLRLGHRKNVNKKSCQRKRFFFRF